MTSAGKKLNGSVGGACVGNHMDLVKMEYNCRLVRIMERAKALKGVPMMGDASRVEITASVSKWQHPMFVPGNIILTPRKNIWIL